MKKNLLQTRLKSEGFMITLSIREK